MFISRPKCLSILKQPLTLSKQMTITGMIGLLLTYGLISSFAKAEELSIYQPTSEVTDEASGVLSSEEQADEKDTWLLPVNYPAMTPASSLMSNESPTKERNLKASKKSANKNDSKKAEETIKSEKKAALESKPQEAAKLRLSPAPSPLGPEANPSLEPPAFKEAIKPKENNLSVKTQYDIQPVSFLPASASPDLEPIQLRSQHNIRPEAAVSIPSLTEETVSPSKQMLPVTPQPSTIASQVTMASHNQGNGSDATMSVNTSDDTAEKIKLKTKKKEEKPPRPVVYYTPLPAIAIFPVVKHGNNQMFSDVPVLFAKEFSRRLEQQAPGTKILNPYYTMESIKARGLEHTYKKVMTDYLYAGRPDPVNMNYLLAQLNNGSETPVARVFFVEADLDTNDPMSPKGMGGKVEKIRSLFDGSSPDYMKYYVRSHIQAYDIEDKNMPQVWNFNWKHEVRADRFNNVTPSVYTDADALGAFTETSGHLSKAALLILPKAVYMEEHVDTSVEGRLAKQSDNEENQANTTDETGMQPIANTPMDTATPSTTDDEGVQLRSRVGRPKKPPTETARQLMNQANRWLH